MKLHHIVGLLLLPAVLIGCTSDDSSISVNSINVNSNISLRDGVTVISAPGQPDAKITDNGDLNIDGKLVTLTADQRDLTKQYYTSVYEMRAQGIATGEAGAAMTGHAIGSVVSGLVHGTPDKIGPNIESQASKVIAQVSLICDNLDRLRSTQDAIVSQVPAFRPYATLNGDKVAQCKKGLDEANHSLSQR